MNDTNQKHFICLGGCEGVSSSAGVCQSVECDDYNLKLMPCNCTNGEHNAFAPYDEEEGLEED